MNLIPRSEVPLICAAITSLCEKHGHPDDIPIGSLAECGINPAAAEACEALLTSEDFPQDMGRAIAKWLRLIAEFSSSNS